MLARVMVSGELMSQTYSTTQCYDESRREKLRCLHCCWREVLISLYCMIVLYRIGQHVSSRKKLAPILAPGQMQSNNSHLRNFLQHYTTSSECSVIRILGRINHRIQRYRHAAARAAAALDPHG